MINNNSRRLASPMAHVIKNFDNVSLDHFLKIICMMNRIDVLFALQKSLTLLKSNSKRIEDENLSRFSTTETALLTSDN